MNRLSTAAPARPITTPAPVTARPCRRTIPRTEEASAPRAIRTPISRVRWAVTKERTP